MKLSKFPFLIIVNFTFIVSAFRGKQDAPKRDCYLYAEHYHEVLRSPCFIDKSLLIKSFMVLRSPVMINAPRRFGKTVNMNMVRAFLEVEQPEKLFKDDTYLSAGCKLFQKHNLSIYQDQTFFREHCGKHPVMFLSFRSITGYKKIDIFGKFRKVVLEVFLKHRYLLNSNRLERDEKNELQKFTSRANHRKLTKRELLYSLMFLSKMMYAHFQKEVIVLIDEFDVPVWQIAFRTIPVWDVTQILLFIRGLLENLLVDNRSVRRALLNGCIRLSGILTTGVNQAVLRFPFQDDHPFAGYYGLTAAEVRAKLDELSMADRHEEVSGWYGGYRTESGAVLYNTWSVMKYLETEAAKSYWVEIVGLWGLDKLFLEPQIRPHFDRLMEWKESRLQFRKSVDVKYVLALRNMTMRLPFDAEHYVETFLEFLCNNGYFTVAKRGHALRPGAVTIPNNEIYCYLHTHMYGRLFYDTFQFDTSRENELAEAARLLGAGESKHESFVRLRESIVNLFRDKSMPNCERAFECCLFQPLYKYFLNLDEFTIAEEQIFKQHDGKWRTIDAVVIRKDGTVMVLEMTYDAATAENALDRIIDYGLYEIVDEYKNIRKRDRIYIGIHLDKNGQATVCYLYNSINKNEKICI